MPCSGILGVKIGRLQELTYEKLDAPTNDRRTYSRILVEEKRLDAERLMDPFCVNAQQGEELQVDSASAYGKGQDSLTQARELAQ